MSFLKNGGCGARIPHEGCGLMAVALAVGAIAAAAGLAVLLIAHHFPYDQTDYGEQYAADDDCCRAEAKPTFKDFYRRLYAAPLQEPEPPVGSHCNG